MKKTLLVVLVMIFSIGAGTAFAMGNDSKNETPKTESNLPADTETLAEVDSEILKARIEEIREMDKSDLSRTEKKELRSELRDSKEVLQSRGIYIGGGALLLIIILILLLN